ncbi:Protein LURP-one-related 15 [Carex littledalei]|uniref:Protein LURP-one-related 15 n=1 Tax=Carex littledalei TaxID=544730 RepID=A0A833R7N6_9POAL|nr:Protein LURP-one-related 15 [Carex littledalei]
MAAIPMIMAPPAPAPAPKITGLETPLAVVGPQFCMPYDVELKVVEKAINLDDASAAVTDANGNMMLKLKGRLLGIIHDKRWLCDVNGVPIVTMQAKGPMSKIPIFALKAEALQLGFIELPGKESARQSDEEKNI